MANKNKDLQKIRISKQHPILLAYALGNIILLIVNRILNIENNYQAPPLGSSPYAVPSSAANGGIVLGVLLIVIVLILEIYLLIAKDVSKVKLILKIFLGFQLIALLLIGIKGNAVGFLLTLIEACFTFTTLKYISSKHSSLVF